MDEEMCTRRLCWRSYRELRRVVDEGVTSDRLNYLCLIFSSADGKSPKSSVDRRRFIGKRTAMLSGFIITDALPSRLYEQSYPNRPDAALVWLQDERGSWFGRTRSRIPERLSTGSVV